MNGKQEGQTDDDVDDERRGGCSGTRMGPEMGSSIKLAKKGSMFGRMFRVPPPSLTAPSLPARPGR